MKGSSDPSSKPRKSLVVKPKSHSLKFSDWKNPNNWNPPLVQLELEPHWERRTFCNTIQQNNSLARRFEHVPNSHIAQTLRGRTPLTGLSWGSWGVSTFETVTEALALRRSFKLLITNSKRPCSLCLAKLVSLKGKNLSRPKQTWSEVNTQNCPWSWAHF